MLFLFFSQLLLSEFCAPAEVIYYLSSQRVLASCSSAVGIISNLGLSLSRHHPRCFWELRVGELANPNRAISHSSDSSQEMPIFKDCLDAFPYHLLGFCCKTKTTSDLFSFLICLVEMRLSSRY